MEFKRLMLFLAVLLLLPFSLTKAEAGNSHFGGQFGQIISTPEKPVHLYALSGTFALERTPEPFRSIFGGLFNEGEVSLMYSADGGLADVKELYGARIVGERDFKVWKGLYSTAGGGAWTVLNSQGGDFAEFMGTIQVGYMLGDYDIHLGADWIHQDDQSFSNDRFWLFAGVLKDF